MLYDARDAPAPKHRLSLPAEKVEFLDDVTLMKKNDFPFVVIANDRKVCFSMEG